jgi:hypothetical protein
MLCQRLTRGLAVVVAVVAMVAMAGSLQADMIITVQCTAGGLSATQAIPLVYNEATADWRMSNPIDIMAGSVQLATVNSLSIQSDSDPSVNLLFGVAAGATNTTFDIQSAVVSFSSLTNPQAYASAGVTLTSDSAGAALTGLFDGGKTYQARYNGTFVYANLVDGFTISGGQTITHGDREPASGNELISDTLSSIQSEFNFTLSAQEQASGTSRFEVNSGSTVPEPATLSLLALGGLALLRRRRGK